MQKERSTNVVERGDCHFHADWLPKCLAVVEFRQRHAPLENNHIVSDLDCQDIASLLPRYWSVSAVLSAYIKHAMTHVGRLLEVEKVLSFF